MKINGVSYQPHDFPGMVVDQSTPEWMRPYFQFLAEWHNEKPLIEVQTSGSTGEPKSISIAKEEMIQSAKLTIQHFRLPEKLVAGICLPASFIAGKMMLVRAIVGNWDVAIDKPSITPFLHFDGKIDFIAITPPILDWMIAERKQFFEAIETVIVGGGQIAEHALAPLKGMKNRVYATYGMTETLTHIAAMKVSGGAEPHFTALPGIEFAVDERQCLKVFASHLQSSPFQTNDIVRLIDNKHFDWMGRADFVINSGGVKLFPEEMEKTIAAFVGTPFFITHISSERWGQRPVWVIEGRERDLSDAMRELETRFGKIALPEQVLYFKSLLRSHTGKLLRIIPNE